MVAKLAIHVCPVPGCLTISAKSGACPKHPHKALVREIYKHQPKLGATQPGDLSGAKPGGAFGNFDFDGSSMGDILGNLFGNAGKQS